MDYANEEFRRSESITTSEEQPPPALEYIWRWFQGLADWRDSGFGLGPLTHCEIEAWARLFRIDITPSEVEALRMLDRAFRKYHAEKNEPEKPVEPEQPRSIARELLKHKEEYEKERNPQPKPRKKVKKDG